MLQNVYVVTGGSNGLGKQIVDALLLNESNLVVNVDIAVPAKIPDSENYMYLSFDIRMATGWMSFCRRLADYITTYYKDGVGIFCLINNAGINRLQWLHKQPWDHIDEVIDTNLKGVIYGVKAMYDLLSKFKGTVVNISSIAAYKPMRCSTAYNASKAGVSMVTRQMAREFSNIGITVFAIEPNKMDDTKMAVEVDEMVSDIRGWDMEYTQKYELSTIPCGYYTPVKRLAEYIVFLLESKERHGHLSGCVIEYGI